MYKVTKVIAYFGAVILGLFFILMGSENIYEQEDLLFAGGEIIAGLCSFTWGVLAAKQLDVSWPFDRKRSFLFLFQLFLFGAIVSPLAYIGQDLYVRGDAQERSVQMNSLFSHVAQSEGNSQIYREALLRTKLKQAQHTQSVGLMLLCLIPLIGLLFASALWPMLSISRGEGCDHFKSNNVA